MRRPPARKPPPGFLPPYTARAHRRWAEAIIAAERACGLSPGSKLGALIVDLMIRSKIGFFVREMETHARTARARRRQQQQAKKDLPEVVRRWRLALRKVRSTEHPTAAEESEIKDAIAAYFRTRDLASGRHYDRRQRQRIENAFRRLPGQISADNPTRSSMLTDLLLVPLWELIEEHGKGRNLSERRVAALVREIVVSFLPLALARGLTVEAVRRRTSDALLRESQQTKTRKDESKQQLGRVQPMRSPTPEIYGDLDPV